MKSLKELLSTLSDKEAESVINPEDTDPRVRAGVEALIRNAKEEVGKLQTEYRDAVMNTVLVIAANGSGAEKFAEYAEKLGAISIDFELISKRLVNTLKQGAVGNIYNSNAHFLLLGELQRIRLEYDMVKLPVPQINSYRDGIYDSPLEQAVSLLLQNNYGTGLQSAITRREIGKKALEARFSGTKLPVIIYNIPEQIDTNFIPNPFTTVEADDKVTEAIVKKKLTEIKASLKKNTVTSADNAEGEQ